jgi:predicted hotdog family 3-hydroxylacyl-ACP dehydratase
MIAPIGKIDISGLIPHSGAMCLLDSVQFWDRTTITCMASSHRDPDHPLATGDGLDSVCGLEYAAQAMATHGALVAAAGRRPVAGYLASVRDVVCRSTRLDLLPDDLEVTAIMLSGDVTGAIYVFDLRCGAETILRGRAAVVIDAGARPLA